MFAFSFSPAFYILCYRCHHTHCGNLLDIMWASVEKVPQDIVYKIMQQRSNEFINTSSFYKFYNVNKSNIFTDFIFKFISLYLHVNTFIWLPYKDYWIRIYLDKQNGDVRSIVSSSRGVMLAEIGLFKWNEGHGCHDRPSYLMLLMSYT